MDKVSIDLETLHWAAKLTCSEIKNNPTQFKKFLHENGFHEFDELFEEMKTNENGKVGFK
nr:hypothetical protein [Heyndrickxia oleronia]